MSNRRTYQFEPSSPKESEITTYTENNTSQSVPSLRAKAISLSFVDPMMEKGYRKWTIDKYDRFHILLYVVMLIWTSLLFIFEYLESNHISTNYFRIGYYAIALIGALTTKLTKKHNDLLIILCSSVLLIVSTADNVVLFNRTAKFHPMESNWIPMLIILHSSMSLIHVRYWLLILFIPVSYFISLCISRSFYNTSNNWLDTGTLWYLVLVVCTSISGLIGQFQQHYASRCLFRCVRMQGNLTVQNRQFRSEYTQHILTLQFLDKSLERKFTVTRWRYAITTNTKYSAFLVSNAVTLIIYEYMYKYSNTNLVLYQCLFHLLPVVILCMASHFITYRMQQELTKKSVKVAWLYAAVREQFIRRYRLMQLLILLVFVSSTSVYIYLKTGTDAPYETNIMLLYLQLSVTTGIGTFYYLLGTMVILVQSFVCSFFRPDTSNYILAILFASINALLYVRLMVIKKRKLFIYESTEESGLFSQLDSQIKSIETISLEYRHTLSTLTKNTNSTDDSRSSDSFNFLENMLSLYSDDYNG